MCGFEKKFEPCSASFAFQGFRYQKKRTNFDQLLENIETCRTGRFGGRLPNLIQLPAAALFGMSLGLGAWGIFSSRASEEIIKAIVFFLRFRDSVRYERLFGTRDSEVYRRATSESGFKYSAAFARSATSFSYSWLRCAGSGARSTEEGWAVTSVFGQSGEDNQRPRFFRIGNSRRKIDRTAVAPIQIRTFGLTPCISASSHGRHASISRALGFWWIRRFPAALHLKCLTAFVT